MSNCSWFCHPMCKRNHHPLLIALIDVKDSNSLLEFKSTLRGYQLSGFDLTSKIHDPNPAFHHPLLHWAAVLGKGDVLKILQKLPFSMNMAFPSDEEETALHRSLKLWDAKEISLKKVFTVIEQLGECLDCSNAELQTPLHICALNLAKCTKQDLPFWKEIMNKIVTTVDDSRLEMVLNAQDANGDTILHMLSLKGDFVDTIHSLLCCGANFGLKNHNNQTAMDISWKYSIAVYNLYRMITTEIGMEQFYVGNNSRRRTRISTGLSKTKDYTSFFENSDQSDEDGDNSVQRKYINNALQVNETEAEQDRRKLRREQFPEPAHKRPRLEKSIFDNEIKGNTKKPNISNELISKKVYMKNPINESDSFLQFNENFTDPNATENHQIYLLKREISGTIESIYAMFKEEDID